MKVRKYKPTGDRILGDIFAKTEKAIKFYYHGWALWIPRSALTKIVDGPYTAPGWAIDSAKAHDSAETDVATPEETLRELSKTN
jgi:hypothetical protein